MLIIIKSEKCTHLITSTIKSIYAIVKNISNFKLKKVDENILGHYDQIIIFYFYIW